VFACGIHDHFAERNPAQLRFLVEEPRNELTDGGSLRPGLLRVDFLGHCVD